MNNKLKILIILSLIIFFLVAILFFPKKKKLPVDEEYFPGLLVPLTLEEVEEIKTLREGSLFDIENKVPDGAKYTIDYEQDETGEPIFLITIDAESWDEFFLIKEEAMLLFKEMGVDPESHPLIEKINITVEDWGSLNTAE